MSEVSLRYAKALYELSADQSGSVLSELRTLENVFMKDKEVQDFFTSPLIKDSDKTMAVKSALKDKGLSENVYNFIITLAQKGRINLFSEVILAFQKISDEANGVTRGEVRSANALSPEERQEIQDVVSKTTKKNVILTYEEDPNLIGGLIAEVGSYTFDDTLTSHLRRLNDDLKRRTH